MAAEPETTWYSGEVSHEGFPLHLRFPEKPDFDSLSEKFPKLLFVTHALDKVTSSGEPESSYNETLSEFDHEIINAFSTPFMGLTVLVETFGGERTYYMYVSKDASIENRKLYFSTEYPQHNLSWEIKNDPDWKFIRGYSSDYKFY